MERRCDKCEFFQSFEMAGRKNPGQCRRHAPIIHDLKSTKGEYPCTMGGGWCGEFSPKDNVLSDARALIKNFELKNALSEWVEAKVRQHIKPKNETCAEISTYIYGQNASEVYGKVLSKYPTAIDLGVSAVISTPGLWLATFKLSKN